MIHFFNVSVVLRLALLLAFAGSGFVSGIEFEVCRKRVVGDGMLLPVVGIPKLEVAFFKETFVRRFFDGP